ncbi:Cytochrome c oxidase subunit 2 precursor [Symmachiella dynata]|uniref:Cytochrome c oxidase subunit 2 n=2 Tax=Symmachiella dynata TaxID=2527995 RepID=A0A517ZXQ0_9PLAN|nr:Cytochrome c oxidase subunit 2 precursor [Symmachiella dynata]
MYFAAMKDRPVAQDGFQLQRSNGTNQPNEGRRSCANGVLMTAKRPSRIVARSIRCVLLTALVLLGTDNVVLAESTSIFDTASYNSEKISEIFMLVLAITGLIFVLVIAAIAVFVVRFRARRSETEDEPEPPQIYGSWPIEIAWTIAPLLIIFVLFLVVVRSVNEQRPTQAPGDAVQVRVIGNQWWWSFEYPELGFTTANELHVPLDESADPSSVFMQLESADVAHSFWVPRLAGKTDLIPNRINTMWFTPNATGIYYGQCAEYCGTQHSKMLLRVIVETPSEFAAWVENEKKPAVNDPAVADGRALFLEHSCASCHTIRGTNARGTFGPDLTHLMSRQTIGAGAAENNHDNLITWITNPHVFKTGCYMPEMKLTAENVKTIVSYLESLR